jgi:hypothetical protein
VTAEGFEPWSHKFFASRDLRVDVSMKAIAAPPVEPLPKPVATGKPQRPPVIVQPQQPVRPTRPAPKPDEGGQGGGRPKRVITELDY